MRRAARPNISVRRHQEGSLLARPMNLPPALRRDHVFKERGRSSGPDDRCAV